MGEVPRPPSFDAWPGMVTTDRYDKLRISNHAERSFFLQVLRVLRKRGRGVPRPSFFDAWPGVVTTDRYDRLRISDIRRSLFVQGLREYRWVNDFSRN